MLKCVSNEKNVYLMKELQKIFKKWCLKGIIMGANIYNRLLGTKRVRNLSVLNIY